MIQQAESPETPERFNRVPLRLLPDSLVIRSASSKVSGSISSWLTEGASTKVATLRARIRVARRP
jgi:hypothetical protein